MKEYNKKRPCEKCGSKNIKDEYKDLLKANKILDPFFDVPETTHPKTKDFIQRTCNNCGYFWNEETLN